MCARRRKRISRMERKLASVQRIKAIEAIEGADRIVKASVLGWHCVTQKSNNFKPGDLCVYFEVDSLIPLSNPSFSWLADPKKLDQTHHRLKTIRLKGQIAQGLILPLSALSVETHNGKLIFTDVVGEGGALVMEVEEGTDLTEVLGITKYEDPIPECNINFVAGGWPFFLAQTDETRVQVLDKVIEAYKGTTVAATEKIDGTSFTCFYYTDEQADRLGLPIKAEDNEKKYTLGVCSRKLQLKRNPDSAYWKMVEKYNLEEKLVKYGKPLAIQGEMFGPSIQDNKLKRVTTDLAVFNVFDLESRTYLSREEFYEFCAAQGLTPAPEVYEPFVLDQSVDQLVTRATIRSKLNPEVWAEGIVIRAVNETEWKGLGRSSFKVINPEFQLKFGC